MLKRIVTLACLAAMAWAGIAALTLEECVLGGKNPEGLGPMTPARDAAMFYRMSDDGKRIERVNLLTGDAVTIFDTTILPDCAVTSWDGFEMSDNEEVILLWTVTEPIYRYSFSANYYTYDRRSGRLTRVSDSGGEEIATLSPDGGQVAYVKGNNIFLHAVDGGATFAVTTDGEPRKVIYGVPDWVYQEELSMLNSIRWSPDGRTLAFLRWDEADVPMYSMTLYEGDCAPHADYALYPGRFDFKYPVAGERNSTVTAHTYDVATGEMRTLDVCPPDGYIIDLNFAPSGQLMVSTMNRQQNDLAIERMDVTGGDRVRVYHESCDTWIEPSLAQQVQFGKDGFVLPSERDGFARLYAYDYTGNLRACLTCEGENVTQYYGSDGRATHFYQRTAGPLNRVVCSVDRKGRERLLSSGDGWSSATFDRALSCFVEQWSDIATPPRYRVKRATGKAVRDVELNTTYAARYTAADVPRREFFTITSDGVTLNGYTVRPVDFDSTRRYPVIMIQYSGPGSQQVRNRWNVDWDLYAATQGYVIACVDGRGTGARERDFKTIVYRNLGHYETIDQLAAARRMASLPWVDAERIGIWGWSYGGYETLMAMSQPESHYAAGVAIAPVTSWRFYDTTYTERFMDTPQRNEQGYVASAPLGRVEDLKGRLMIVFGSADDNVHIINSMQYIAKLHGQHTMFDMMVYTNMNHSINGCDVRLPLYRRVLEHYDRYLKQ